VSVSGIIVRGNTILVSGTARGIGTVSGLFLSSDGGATFNLISGTGNLRAGAYTDLAADPGNLNRVYAALLPTINGNTGVITTQGGVFRSDDLGANWTDVTGGAGAAINQAAVANANGVFSGTNNIKLDVHNNAGGGTNSVFVGVVFQGQDNGFFRSVQGVDGVNNDGDATTDEPDETNFVAMDLPRTNEGGPVVGLQPTTKPGSQGATHFSISADPGQPNLIYAAGDRQVGPYPNSVGAVNPPGSTARMFRGDANVAPTGAVPSPQWNPLTDNGTANGTAPHADSRDTAFRPNGDLIEVNDGGIVRRTSPQNANGDWFSLNNNLQVTEIHDVAYDTISNVLIGGDQDTGTPEQSGAGSPSWRTVTGADGGDVAVDSVSLAGSNMSIRYNSTQNLGNFQLRICDNANNCGAAAAIALNTTSGTVLTTGNNGNAQFVTPVELNVVDPARLLIGGANNVYESTDQGANVAMLNPTFPAGQSPVAIVNGHPNNEELVYVGVSNPGAAFGAVFVRTTAGMTLSATATAYPGGVITDLTVDPDDEDVIYVVDTTIFNNGTTTPRAFTSPDGGSTWNEITGNLPALVSGALSAPATRFQTVEYVEGDVNDILVVGTNSGVFASIEPHFDCWFELGTGLPNVLVWDLDYDPIDDVLALGTMGRGAWILRGLSDLTVPILTMPGDVTFGDTCVGRSSIATLDVCNTGREDLLIFDITSSDPQFEVVEPTSGYPLVISPDFCFPFQVIFTPTSAGEKSATITVDSNDPCTASSSVTARGRGVLPNISTIVANAGEFGDVCTGTFRDLDLTINNSGECDLTISNLTSTSADFKAASAMSFPLRIHPGDSLHLPIRFAPSSFGAKAGEIRITSNDPDTPLKAVPFTGNAPPGEIRVTGSTDFGDVCAGELAEKTISVCNVGLCNLTVTSVAFDPPCLDFQLNNNPFPSIVSHDFCLDVVIRFTPQSVGMKMCTLVITSDDPVTPVVSLKVTGNTPVPSIDVPPDQSFPATVVRTLGNCPSLVKFPISNTGTCDLTITNIEISVNGGEFSLDGLPSFPVILQPGHIAGEGDLRITFSPLALARERSGEVSVTYVSDSITGATTVIRRKLCGEAVRTGARVLVTAGGAPVAQVEKIHLLRINANRNREAAELDSVEVSLNVPPTAVTPTAPCIPFTFHKEYGTVSNVNQLLPGAYQVSVTAVVSGKRETRIVGFSVDTCDFNQNIKVEF